MRFFSPGILGYLPAGSMGIMARMLSAGRRVGDSDAGPVRQ